MGHRLAVLHRIQYHLDIKCKVAYLNRLVLPHMDYVSIIWRDQPEVKAEMTKLHGIQNNFANWILTGTQSSDKALMGELGDP